MPSRVETIPVALAEMWPRSSTKPPVTEAAGQSSETDSHRVCPTELVTSAGDAHCTGDPVTGPPMPPPTAAAHKQSGMWPGPRSGQNCLPTRTTQEVQQEALSQPAERWTVPAHRLRGQTGRHRQLSALPAQQDWQSSQEESRPGAGSGPSHWWLDHPTWCCSTGRSPTKLTPTLQAHRHRQNQGWTKAPPVSPCQAWAGSVL